MSTGQKKITKIYGLSSSDNPDRIRYIGQTTITLHKRLIMHRTHSKHTTSHTPVGKWIRSKINKGLEIKITLLKDNAIWNVDEIKFIKIYSKKSKLLNCTDGGQGHLGSPMSKQARKNISNALIGKKKSKEHAENISKSKIGVQLSPQHRANMGKHTIGISPVNKGVPMSEKQKLEISVRKGSRPFCVYDKFTNKFVGQWINKTQCCRDLKIHPYTLQQVLNNNYSSSRKYNISYMEVM